MKIILISLLSLTLSILSFSQDISKDSILHPFKIDDRYLSGLDIPQLKLKDDPDREYYQKRIYKGTDLSVYILSSATTENRIDQFPIDEFVYYLNGRADIQAKDSTQLTFYAGDYLFVPKGFSGTWTNNGGNRLHLELSIISNERADANLVSKEKYPFLLDRALLSGIGLTKLDSTCYKDVLYSGLELEVLTESEESTLKEITDNPKEELIHILNGSLTIHSQNEESQTFYRGDFFILPKGFSGTWESKGQNLLRILKVVAK